MTGFATLSENQLNACTMAYYMTKTTYTVIPNNMSVRPDAISPASIA